MQLKVRLPIAIDKFWQPLPHEYVCGTLEELCSLSGQLELNLEDYCTIQPTFRVLEAQEKHGLNFGDGKSIVFEKPEWWEVLEVEACPDIGTPQLQRVMDLNPDLSVDRSLSLLGSGSVMGGERGCSGAERAASKSRASDPIWRTTSSCARSVKAAASMCYSISRCASFLRSLYPPPHVALRE